MNEVNTISTAGHAGGLLTLIGGLLLVFCLPMSLGLLRRNVLWGIRTRTTTASEHNWRVMNQKAGTVGTAWGLVMLALAVLAWLLVPEGLNEAVYNLLVAVPGLAFALHLAVVVIRSGRALQDRPSLRRWPGPSGPGSNSRSG